MIDVIQIGIDDKEVGVKGLYGVQQQKCEDRKGTIISQKNLI